MVGDMEEQIDAFIAGWLRENEAVIDEVVALQGDNPATPYGAAVAASMATVRSWSPKGA
jgi:hypothetical protein